MTRTLNNGVSNLELQNSSIGFTPTAGNKTIVYQFGARSAGGWAAVTKSASGNMFVRLSTSSTIFDFGPGPAMPNPLPAGYATAWIVTAHTRVNE